MNDFIFGTLATDELRRARVLSIRGGVSHNFGRFPYDPCPNHPIALELTTGPNHLGERAWVYWTEDDTDPSGALGQATNGYALAMEPVGSTWDTELWGYIRKFKVELPGQQSGTVVRYRLSLDEYGKGEVFADGGVYHAFYVADDPTPDWTKDAVIYQIFPDRFSPGKGKNWLNPATPAGIYGGKIRGITENLDYIAGLGANTLWLCPIFPSPSHHGYDMSDLFDIEPRLGSKADLRQLLDEAHSRRMKVLLDFVPNHWSDQHPTFQDAIRNPSSAYRDWYLFSHWPDRYESFFGVKDLPQVNLRNPAARKYMLDAARYWLEFGVDGYRVDYAIGPSPDFWADFRKCTFETKPDCWTFGEIVDPPDVQLSFEGLLDGALDFMLLEAFRQTFAFSHWDGTRFAGFLEKHEEFFPSTFSRPSFLDNHDMNRFLWAAGGDLRRLKLAALCQFTLPGSPVIYYGTEVGLSQQRDVRQGARGLPEEARLPMIWGDQQNRNLLDFYQKLIGIRKTTPVFAHGEREILIAEKDVLAYRCFGTGRPACVVLNMSDKMIQRTLDNQISEQVISSEASAKVDHSSGNLQVSLPPLTGAIFH